jgi:hypothetical protein
MNTRIDLVADAITASTFAAAGRRFGWAQANTEDAESSTSAARIDPFGLNIRIASRWMVEASCMKSPVVMSPS